MPSELEELVELLHSPQPAVRQIALDNLVGFSAVGPQQKIFAYDNHHAIKDLKKLSQESNNTTVQQSVTIMANLCDDIEMRRLIVEDADYLRYLVGRILALDNRHADLMCILLTNMAKNDHITKVFDFEYASVDKTHFKSTKALDCLMDCFVKGSEYTLNKFANFDYLAYFFADISRFSKGRNYFITEQSYDSVVPISKLLVFTEKYDTKIRREGVASTIKNSLFDAKRHYELLTDDRINILPYLLLPIAGPELDNLDEEEMFNLPDELQLLPPDKKREPISDIIQVHLESLLLLCTTREGREFLREKSCYAIIREMHKVLQQDELVDELCNRLVQMLARDEAPTNEEIDAMNSGDDDSDDDKIVEVA